MARAGGALDEGFDLITAPLITPVILAGGTGSRLWPLSRALFPKQLLPLVSDDSMLQETVRRVTGPGFAPPLVICNDEHRFIIAEQLRRMGVDNATIVLEPAARNTAPAATVAALLLADADPAALMLVMPSDHVIADLPAFQAGVETALAAAKAGSLVTFGIHPTAPVTGYGYILRGTAMEGLSGCSAVARFVEKPDLATAEAYLAGGKHLWNSGMFLFSAGRFLEELGRHRPAILAACQATVATVARDLEFVRLPAEAFAACPSEAIDTAVMENTDSAAVVEVDLGWSDVGSWAALAEIGKPDADGNVLRGDVMAIGSSRSYLRSEGPLVAALGVDDLIVVATKDAVLVASRDQAEAVKSVVEALKAAGRTEHHGHLRVARPWGAYESVADGARFQVKRIIVDPGQRISLQMHYHRAEHWVVVRGTAKVTRGEEELLLHENQSVFIPLGTVHRLENPGKVQLEIIEVQSGAYLGEDDIVRFEDVYGRQ